MDDSHTARALAALTEASVIEQDFPGWLAGVLARAAARHGSSYALVSGRPGSWEADLVLRLIRGRAGWDDGELANCEPLLSSADLRTAHRGTDRPLSG
jgi:hypothetical protein